MSNHLLRAEMDQIEEDYGDIDIGRIVRINHNSDYCSGHSKSLKIERKEDGLYAKCYRCGRYGKSVRYYSTTPKSGKVKSRSENNGGCTTHIAAELPRTPEITRVEEWPKPAREWIRQYITDREVENNGICYVPSIGRIRIDVGLGAYQTRRVYGWDEKPKYLTYGVTNSTLFHLRTNRNGNDICVIVEDVISCIKCSRYCDSIALLSTSLQDQHIKFLYSQRYPKVIIFFDDDNITVRKNAEKCRKVLSKFTNVTVVHSNGRDPKEHTDSELEELLK